MNDIQALTLRDLLFCYNLINEALENDKQFSFFHLLQNKMDF